MLTFYYAAGTCALASHIALEDAGAAYEAKRINFKAAEQTSSAYLRINPKGRVPALITDHGVLTETPAILAYIAQTHPAARLAPFDDAFALAELQSFNAYLCSTVHVAHAHRMRGYRWADEESSFVDMKRRVPGNVAACFELIETQLLKGPWVMGDAYTIADPYLYTLASWSEGDGVAISKFPKIEDHFARMSARDSVRRALAAEAA